DINNLSKTNLIISQITKAKKLNGKTFKAEINYTSLQANNTTTNIYVIKDITERQKTEKKLLKAKELKESNQVMKEFMTNMSHELRSPMNAIIGISKMLTKYKSDNLSAKQTEGLKTISESGKRLLDLINDILDLSKLEANKAKVIYESLSIEKLKSTLKSTIISLIGDKPINFLIHASPNVPERIITDHKKLMQILLNLLGNGIKFTEKGKITLNIHCKNNLLFFEVTDTGIGISKKNQKTIFDKFKQIDSSTSRQYKGTGLGLAICKSLTQLLNGEISLESEEGKGTTVRFNILFKEDKEKTKRTITSHLKTKNKNYNALIIDDEESSCFLFKNYLNNNNFNVDIASDGITGINKIIKLQPDLIILSLEIPKLSGYGVMKRLKTESQEIQNIPLILTSISDYIPNNTKYNYDLFLNKPINENTFVLFLKEINSSV
ncbi:MAG: ATP-binding protein, partial [Bacteroidota bacterium]|nr:ATP-binding protein [Bacteroidota bacterium]